MRRLVTSPGSTIAIVGQAGRDVVRCLAGYDVLWLIGHPGLRCEALGSVDLQGLLLEEPRLLAKGGDGNSSCLARSICCVVSEGQQECSLQVVGVVSDGVGEKWSVRAPMHDSGCTLCLYAGSRQLDVFLIIRSCCRMPRSSSRLVVS